MAAGFEMYDLEVIWMWGERRKGGKGEKTAFLQSFNPFLFQLNPAKRDKASIFNSDKYPTPPKHYCLPKVRRLTIRLAVFGLALR
jgi:hypothetical protein